MRHYETVFITNPDLSEEENTKMVETYQEILVDGSATMLKVDDWGRRRMAYEIKKVNKGYYTLYEYASDNPASIAEMERRMRIDDNVIRFMTIKGDEQFDLEARQAADAEKEAQLKAEAEAAAKAEAEAKAKAEAEAKEKAEAEAAKAAEAEQAEAGADEAGEDEPAEEPTDEPADESAEEASDEPAEEAAEEAADEPAEKAVEEAKDEAKEGGETGEEK